MKNVVRNDQYGNGKMPGSFSMQHLFKLENKRGSKK